MEAKDLLARNKEWAARMLEQDDEFFSRLEHQQSPRFLWIGCSDSRVPANQITGLPPGEVFVHRNIANLVIHTDFNALSVIEFAIERMSIEHIIVCGHYGCSGIKAAMAPPASGFVDNWLRHIRDIQFHHSSSLDTASDLTARENMLTEWNVKHQVLNVGESSFVEKAWNNGRKLNIHGWVYSLQDGLIRDMGISLKNMRDLETLARHLRADPQGT